MRHIYKPEYAVEEAATDKNKCKIRDIFYNVLRFNQDSITGCDSIVVVTKKGSAKGNCMLHWLAQCNGWVRPFYLHVTTYSAGIIRLRNDTYNYPPKKVWPYTRNMPEPDRKFEHSYYEEELLCDYKAEESPILDTLRYCMAPSLGFNSELFPERDHRESDVPAYAWSFRGHNYYDDRWGSRHTSHMV